MRSVASPVGTHAFVCSISIQLYALRVFAVFRNTNMCVCVCVLLLTSVWYAFDFLLFYHVVCGYFRMLCVFQTVHLGSWYDTFLNLAFHQYSCTWVNYHHQCKCLSWRHLTLYCAVKFCSTETAKEKNCRRISIYICFRHTICQTSSAQIK